MKFSKFIALFALTAFLFSCERDRVFNNESSIELKAKSPSNVEVSNATHSILVNSHSDGFLKSTETQDVELYMAEYITVSESGEMGNVVFFNNVGNKQLGADFVPGLALDGTDNISYYVDDNRPSADLAVAASNDAIDRAMTTWEGVNCSDLGMFEVPFDGRPTGFVSALFGFGGSFAYTADVVHSGWMPALFFDFLAPGGSSSILGVTFTITFTNSDVDNNGKADVAFREIYYNDNFFWQDGGNIDVETVALHEAGHGLSQAHFGKAFLSGNGKLHFAPRAVMNATYSGIQTAIGKTDNGGHCSNWASWPNN